MAEHGYARDYDDPIDRSAIERERPRNDYRDRDWRNEPRDRNERNGNFMLGDRGSRTDWDRSPRSFGSQQDGHYISWRNRQMEALDRDYDDYCREREEQFHRDFDAWRRDRQVSMGLQWTGQPTDQRNVSSSEAPLELNTKVSGTGSPSPMSDATVGNIKREPGE